MAEEQHKQLSELHKSRPSEEAFKEAEYEDTCMALQIVAGSLVETEQSRLHFHWQPNRRTQGITSGVETFVTKLKFVPQPQSPLETLG